jgi:hypothetical protein
MSDGYSSLFGGLFWLAALSYGGYWYYTEHEASAGMSGNAFYETCWEYKSKTIGFNEPKPSNPYQAAQWKNCETVVRRGIFEQGIIFVGAESGDDFDRLRKSCPDSWSETSSTRMSVPGGAFFVYIEDTEAAGGLSGLNGLLPAIWSVKSWAKKRWPNCSSERQRQGYPKIVEKAPDVYDWEKPCPKCK